MPIIKTGTVIDANPSDRSFNGRSGKGWMLQVAKEEDMPGFYIYYSSPLFPGEGYDDWFEDEVVLERNIEHKINSMGWKIQWDE